ncbi:MAG: NAD-dependent epimerase/dehydratase family protein [Polyangiaceae bacterium]|nr:NAD-dependent epimerase/dehydratase family protein [Polyangiaceae bacterium]
MRALVVGGTGFVGMNVARALVRHGHDVAITRRVRANTLFARKLGAKLVVAELDDVDSLEGAMRGRDVVFHCAGYYPRYSVNPDEQVAIARRATANVLNAAERAGVQRLVLTSSVATIGSPTGGRVLSNEGDRMSESARSSVYFLVKDVIEQDVLSVKGVDTVVACPAGIVGELDVKAGTGFVFLALSRGMMPLYVDGKANIVDADDMADGHVAVALRGKGGQRYILGGHNTTVREFLVGVSEELGVQFRSCRIPLAVAGPLATFDEMRCVMRGKGERPFMAREFVDMVRYGQWFDASKAAADLDFLATTPMHLTIRKACAWYRRFRYISRAEQVEPATVQVRRSKSDGQSSTMQA